MRRMSGLRSNFLVHWTGKDIQTDYEHLCKKERKLYVDRLCTTLDDGLWMMPVEEKFKLYARPEEDIEYEHVPATCFTEIRLSATNKHTQAYGCLGFGFERRFVIDQCGEPVQYVSENSPIVRDMTILFDKLKAKNLEEEIKLMNFNFCFLKNMSDGPECSEGSTCFLEKMSDCPYCSEDFAKLDEAEWRILYMNDKKQQPNVVSLGNGTRPNAKVIFGSCDLKVLILPDDRTRRMALDDEHIWDWLSRDRSKLPVITTVAECLQF